MPFDPGTSIELFFFGFTLWLGSYLLAGTSQKTTVRLTGFGLCAYAVALGIHIISEQFVLPVMLLPAKLWIGAALHLLPEEKSARAILIRVWARTAIPIIILTLLQPWFAVPIIGALLASAAMIARLIPSARFKNTVFAMEENVADQHVLPPPSPAVGYFQCSLAIY